MLEIPSGKGIDAAVARKLVKFLNDSSHFLSYYVDVIFYPTNSLAEDREVETDRTIIDNSYLLVRFKFSEKEQRKQEEWLPEGYPSYKGGYVLLYVPEGTKRLKEPMQRGPTYDERMGYRLAMHAFLAGWKAKGSSIKRARQQKLRKVADT